MKIAKRTKSLFKTSDRIDVSDGYHLTVIDYPDADSLVKYLNDKTIYGNTCSIPYPYTIDDANNFITKAIAFEEEHGVQREWAIRNKDGEQIGAIGMLYNYGMASHRSEIGYWIARPYWNQGIMTRVVRTFVRHIFSITDLIRLEALVFEHNEASCRVLEKAGFTQEGFLRNGARKEGKGINVWLYGLVRD